MIYIALLLLIVCHTFAQSVVPSTCPPKRAPACSSAPVESCGLCDVIFFAWTYNGAECIQISVQCEATKAVFMTKAACEQTCGSGGTLEEGFDYKCPSPRAPACSTDLAKSCGYCYILYFAWIYEPNGCYQMLVQCSTTKLSFRTKRDCEQTCSVPNVIESEECCKSKTVGGITYNLLENSTDVVPQKCTKKCVYQKEGSLSRYCFAPGSLPVECREDSSVNPNYNIKNNLPIPFSISGQISFFEVPQPWCNTNITFQNIPPNTEEIILGHGCPVKKVTASASGTTCTPFNTTDTPAGNSFEVSGFILEDKLVCFVEKAN